MLEEKPSVIYGVILKTASNPDNKISISKLCKLAKVSKSGYYRWLGTEEKRKQKEIKGQEDFAKILEAYNYKGYNKGYRSIYMRLLRLSEPVKRILRRLKTNEEIWLILPN